MSPVFPLAVLFPAVPIHVWTVRRCSAHLVHRYMHTFIASCVCGLSLELAGVVSQDPFAFYVCFRVIVLTVVISKLLFSSCRGRAFGLLRAELYYHNNLSEKRKLPVIFLL